MDGFVLLESDGVTGVWCVESQPQSLIWAELTTLVSLAGALVLWVGQEGPVKLCSFSLNRAHREIRPLILITVKTEYYFSQAELTRLHLGETIFSQLQTVNRNKRNKNYLGFYFNAEADLKPNSSVLGIIPHVWLGQQRFGLETDTTDIPTGQLSWGHL